MLTLPVVDWNTTVFMYNKIKNQFPWKGKKKVSKWSLTIKQQQAIWLFKGDQHGSQCHEALDEEHRQFLKSEEQERTERFKWKRLQINHPFKNVQCETKKENNQKLFQGLVTGKRMPNLLKHLLYSLNTIAYRVVADSWNESRSLSKVGARALLKPEASFPTLAKKAGITN